MKKLFSLLVVALGAIAFVNAQTSTSAPETLTNNANATQGVVLSVTNTSANVNNGNNDLVIQSTGANNRTQLTVAPSGTSAGAFLQVTNSSDPANAGIARLGVRGDYSILSLTNKGTPAASVKNVAIELDSGNDFVDEAFVITTDDFNVDGTPTILAKVNASGLETIEAKVLATVAAPDYVFADDYELRSLEEVEAYINENSHLPEIPSAAEFEVDGIKLGKMSFDLLKKVEELTLYMIDMKKENEELKARIADLEDK